MKQTNKTKQTYHSPSIEVLELRTPLSLLDSLSTEGDLHDWTQESPVETTEVE